MATVESPGAYTLSGEATDPRNRSVAFAKDALDYLETATILLSMDDSASNLSFRLMKPFHFLICQGLELALKAVLVCEGATDDDLMKIGHRLNVARDACERSGIKFGEDAKSMIDWLSGYHESHLFRYYRAGRLTVPRPSNLIEVVKPEIQRLTDIVFVRVRKRLRKAAQQRRRADYAFVETSGET